MTLALALATTPNAKRYMLQLTKHFAHKIPTWQLGNEGLLTFPMGTCALRANDTSLSLTVAAPDAEALAQTQDVVERHLLRFAFRETLSLVWRPATADEAAQQGMATI